MPLVAVAAQQAFISAYFGADASGIPASFEAALWAGDLDTGVEFAYTGYARVVLTNNTTTFVPGADGSATAGATFPDATAAATTDDADRWVLLDHADGTTVIAWDFLETPVSVDAAGPVTPIEISPYLPNDTSVT